jgi:hypothetical protein
MSGSRRTSESSLRSHSFQELTPVDEGAYFADQVRSDSGWQSRWRFAVDANVDCVETRPCM